MKLDVLKGDSWGNLKKILLFGYGKQGKKVLKTLNKDFEVIGIVDNDVNKSGTTKEGIPVLTFNEAVTLLKENKIIITAAEFYYKQIREQLQELGLIENQDFVMYQSFIMDWYYRYKQKIYVLKTDVVVSSVCSLRCKNCSLFIPYWKNNISFDIEQLKEDAESYFRCVDYVFDMDIVGGEPFLYKGIDEIISWYGEHYGDKIGYLGVITNGTVIPKQSTIEVIKKYGVTVSISDYSKEVGYEHQVEKLCEILQNNEIEYTRNTDIQWFDFGFPEPKYYYAEDKVKEHMRSCNTICHIISENRLWYCSSAWAAYKSGLYPNAFRNGVGYVKLDEIDERCLEQKKNILDCCRGNMGERFVDFCRVCGGFGADNQNRIKTAEQLNCR